MSESSNKSSGESAESQSAEPTKLEQVATGGDVRDVVQPGHEYDGIREYDNPVPAWLTYIFLGTIAWSGVYLAGRVVGVVPSFNEQLDRSQQALLQTRLEAESQKTEITRDMLVEAVGASERISEGEKIFKNNCKQCHADDGGGLVGPNLTDSHWINDGNLKGIYAVIRDGANNNQMPSWEDRLSQQEMISVTAYVRELHGTEPADGKPPEGDEWVEKDGEFVPADQS